MNPQVTKPVNCGVLHWIVGSMDGDGQNQSGRISSQERRKIQARRHLTLLPSAELSTSQDIPDDKTLLNELPVGGGSPNLNSSFGRECRTTPPRSNTVS